FLHQAQAIWTAVTVGSTALQSVQVLSRRSSRSGRHGEPALRAQGHADPFHRARQKLTESLAHSWQGTGGEPGAYKTDPFGGSLFALIATTRPAKNLLKIGAGTEAYSCALTLWPEG